VTPIDILAVFAWPLAFLGIWIFIVACRERTNRRLPRWLLLIMAAVLFFVPLSTLAFHSSETQITATAFTFISVFIGAGFNVAAAFGIWGIRQSIKNPGRLSKGKQVTLSLLSVVFAVLGAASIIYGARQLTGDILLSRGRVEGVVQQAQTTFNRRLGYGYRLKIDGKSYWATAAAFDGVRVGDRVRVVIGAGSGMIYRLDLIDEVRPPS